MINLKLYKGNLIRVNTKDVGFLYEVKAFFTEHVEGYNFMPLYKAGQWDGTVSLFNTNNRTFPFGLLFDFIQFWKKSFDYMPLTVDPEIKQLFKGDEGLTREFDLKHEPRPYQLECIEAAIKHRSCSFLVGTSGGKSLILAYIWKILRDNNVIQNTILVVPTINLVTQFKADLIDYGVDESLIGEVYGDVKQWDNSIVISTWQTLHNNLHKLDLYDSIFVDEVHQCRAAALNDILQQCSHMLYKIGCTGTFPENRLENLNIKSYIGPTVKTFPVSYLIKHGYASECDVKVYNVLYRNQFNTKLEDGKSVKLKFNEVKDIVFEQPYRLNLLSNIIKSVGDDNILLLVGKIAKEGQLLEDYLNGCDEFKDYQIKFIYSKTKPKEREEWRQKCIKEKKIILIAVYALFQLGINIPNLNHIVLASSNKTKIRTLQSIGRSLRKNGRKSSTIYDIVDHSNKFLPKHAKERQRFYKAEEFGMEFIELKE
jgi:superfamily II DNA or RNA helicase